jgi:hypothetical protein
MDVQIILYDYLIAQGWWNKDVCDSKLLVHICSRYMDIFIVTSLHLTVRLYKSTALSIVPHTSGKSWPVPRAPKYGPW